MIYAYKTQDIASCKTLAEIDMGQNWHGPILLWAEMTRNRYNIYKDKILNVVKY